MRTRTMTSLIISKRVCVFVWVQMCVGGFVLVCTQFKRFCLIHVLSIKSSMWVNNASITCCAVNYRDSCVLKFTKNLYKTLMPQKSAKNEKSMPTHIDRETNWTEISNLSDMTNSLPSLKEKWGLYIKIDSIPLNGWIFSRRLFIFRSFFLSLHFTLGSLLYTTCREQSCSLKYILFFFFFKRSPIEID